MGVKKGETSFTTKEKKIMARKITTESVAAFMAGRNFNKDNTRVAVDSVKYDLVHLYLHNNLIAKRYNEDGKTVLMVSNAGWFSTTTKERLNGIPGVSIQQKKGVWFLNGQEWDGSWITV